MKRQANEHSHPREQTTAFFTTNTQQTPDLLRSTAPDTLLLEDGIVQAVQDANQRRNLHAVVVARHIVANSGKSCVRERAPARRPFDLNSRFAGKRHIRDREAVRAVDQEGARNVEG